VLPPTRPTSTVRISRWCWSCSRPRARALALRALTAGKPVVTGNKELLASAGAELEAAAHAGGADLAFEAAVAGGIPLIRPLRESLAGDRVTRMLGVVNGTTNYILTQMSERGWGFDEALAEAQCLWVRGVRSHCRRRRSMRRRNARSWRRSPSNARGRPTMFTERGSPREGAWGHRRRRPPRLRRENPLIAEWIMTISPVRVHSGHGAPRRNAREASATPSTPCSSRRNANAG
jgi:hypothetical protein